MTPESVTFVTQWGTLIGMFVGFATVLITVGKKDGVQETTNKNIEVRVRANENGMKSMQQDVTEIKEDVSFIKGQLSRTINKK